MEPYSSKALSVRYFQVFKQFAVVFEDMCRRTNEPCEESHQPRSVDELDNSRRYTHNPDGEKTKRKEKPTTQIRI